jgi:hypothetical protein
MKTYRVSDFEQGCPNPADLRTQPAWTDATKVEAENVGNTQNLPAEPAEVIQQPRNVGKGKTPADLFELIPSESPIQQAELFETARQAGINQKYARQLLSVLIAEKRIVVQKIPREKTKSALGFIRAPAQPESQGAAEELSRVS